jgi:peptidyl-prolyl cis-trans isomerase SurA
VFKINSLCAIVALSAAPLVAAQDLAEPGDFFDDGATEELSKTGEFIDGIAAIVNEGIVLRSEYLETLDMIVTRAEQEGWPLPPDEILQEQVLERVILNEIQLQRAERIGLQVSDQMLNQFMSDVAAGRGVAFEDLPVQMSEEGVDYQDFRRQMREELTLEQLRRIDVTQRIEISPREIENCIADLEDNVVVNSDYDCHTSCCRCLRPHPQRKSMTSSR